MHHVQNKLQILLLVLVLDVMGYRRHCNRVYLEVGVNCIEKY
jgi:hypothetical protein